MRKIVEDYQLEDKYVVVVSDNGMKSTWTQEPYGWLSCNAHNMNLVLRHFFFNEEKQVRGLKHLNKDYYYFDFDTLLDFDEDLTADRMFQMMFDSRLCEEESIKAYKIKAELKKVIELILACKRTVFNLF